MPRTAPKQLVRQFYRDLFTDADAAIARIAPEYIDHNAPDAGSGPAVLRTHIDSLLATFPDFRLKIEDMIAEGDMVVTRVSGRGTHIGRWMGIEGTGAEIAVKGINIDRVESGLIIEHWGEADTIGMLIQMGVDPFAGRMGKAGQMS